MAFKIVPPYGGSGGIAAGVDSFNGLTGDVTISAGANITLTPAGNNVAIAASGGGGGVTTLNTLAGALTLAAGTNITITPSGGNTLTIDAAGGGGGVANPMTSDLDAGGFSINDMGQGGIEIIADAEDNLLVGSGLVAPPGAATTDNVGIGRGVLAALTTGDSNVAIGNNAAKALTTGAFSVAIGQDALALADTGTINTAVGGFALDALTSGGTNVAIGANALGNLVSGGTNTAVGKDAGLNVTGAGAGNVSLGYQAGPVGAISKTTAVGTGAIPAAAGEIVIGEVTSPQIVSASGVPVNGSNPDGSLYIRQDGGALTHLYFASGGTWTAIA